MTKPDKSKITSSAAAQPSGSDEYLEDLARRTSAGTSLLDAYAALRNGVQTVRDKQSERRAINAEDFAPGADLRATSPVQGVAIALGSEENGGVPGEPALRIYVNERLSKADAIHHVAGVFDIQSVVENIYNVDVAYTGVIDAYGHAKRWRPKVPCGVSVGHINVTAGTLGCYARGREGERRERRLMLSNNHVLAAVNEGEIGDDILQPGSHDGGTSPDDVFGLLENFVAIDFGGINYVDAATAWVDDEYTERQFLRMSASGPSFFAIRGNSVTARPGLQVGKSGRTTGLTTGYVAAVGAAINVRMGPGGVAHYADQIEVRGTRGVFSSPGDSGSLIWTWDASRDAVGLLFAGGGGATFANPVDLVLTALDIDLDT